MNSQWLNKRVAFLGDSITDKNQTVSQKVYWQFLQEMLGLVPEVYGINGDTWYGILNQAERLSEEVGDDIDAISIFVGTNDFNASLPLGSWYDIKTEEVNNRTKIMTSPKRCFNFSVDNYCGRINRAMSFIKKRFVNQQIFLITPIHRAFATFGPDNVQPDESFPNQIGHYVDEYVKLVKEAGNIWAVPVIDLNAASGLFPLYQEHAQYFRNKETDMLHPSTSGHLRMAKVLAAQMLAMPSNFK